MNVHPKIKAGHEALEHLLGPCPPISTSKDGMDATYRLDDNRIVFVSLRGGRVHYEIAACDKGIIKSVAEVRSPLEVAREIKRRTG